MTHGSCLFCVFLCGLICTVDDHDHSLELFAYSLYKAQHDGTCIQREETPTTPDPFSLSDPGTRNPQFGISQTAQVVSWYILWGSKYLLSSYYIDGV